MAVYVLLEILVWGVNLWALSYLYVWALLFVAARLLWRMESSLSWGLLSGFFGLGFGALCAVPYWLTGGWAAAVSWWISGIPWDMVRGMGNFAMAFFLFKPLRGAPDIAVPGCRSWHKRERKELTEWSALFIGRDGYRRWER